MLVLVVSDTNRVAISSDRGCPTITLCRDLRALAQADLDANRHVRRSLRLQTQSEPIPDLCDTRRLFELAQFRHFALRPNGRPLGRTLLNRTIERLIVP